MSVTTPVIDLAPYPWISARPAASSSLGGSPSRERNPCIRAADALRACPASMTATVRRARARTRAADRPEAPPPMTTTSYVFMPRDSSAGGGEATVVAVSGNQAFDLHMAAPVSVDAALALVAPRLRSVREHRAMAITAVADQPGISKSTLSRLETGQRRPTLELLLPLAQIYRVPLDDMIGAPDVGDPRIRLKPREVNGRTVLPLTRNPNGVEAWKIIIPRSQSTPKPRTHDGNEWIYVLSGRMRLIIGDSDMVLGVGEVAEFSTSQPHWFGSTGDEPAEVLSVFGRPGERMHARTAPIGSASLDALPPWVGLWSAAIPVFTRPDSYAASTA